MLNPHCLLCLVPLNILPNSPLPPSPASRQAQLMVPLVSKNGLNQFSRVCRPFLEENGDGCDGGDGIDVVMKQTRGTGASNEGGREEEGGGGEGENVTMAGQTNNQATRKDRATWPINAGGLR